MGGIRQVKIELISDRAGRLDTFLRDKLGAEFSRSKIAEYIEQLGVVVGDRQVFKPAHRLRPGDVVRVDWSIENSDDGPTPSADVTFKVIYEDDDLIVIDKPAGIVVHPGAGVEDGTLVSGLLAKYPEIRDVGSLQRPGIVHRLDKDTSGLMIVARSQRAYLSLVDMFQRREIYKEYRVAVVGRPPDSFTVSAPIGRHPVDRKKMAVVPWGKPSVTHFNRLRTVSPDGMAVSILKATLETGRTHQIRVHLRHAGFYPLGDCVYGNKVSQKLAPRVFLHAIVLKFLHPITGQRLEFLSPLPGDLLEAWRSLEVKSRVHD